MHTCTSTKGKEWTHSCFYLKTGKTDVNYAQIHEHFHIKGIFLFYSHWYSAASTEKKKNQSRWGVFVLCMSEYLPGWGWQLGSSFFQSAFVDAAPAPSGQSLNLGCPMWRKQRHTLSLNLKKIHHGEKSACSYLCNMYRLFWRNTESVISHCATMFYSQLAGQRRRSPAEQNTLIITAQSMSVGSCHRSQ